MMGTGRVIASRIISRVDQSWVVRCSIKLAVAFAIFMIFDWLLFPAFSSDWVFGSLYNIEIPLGSVFWYATIILFFVLGKVLMPAILQTGSRRIVVLAGGFAVLCAAMIGFAVLESFPNSADEYAYLFQSWTYLAGRLTNAAPPLGQIMAPMYTWVYGTHWAGQYGPGWPLMMALAVGLHLPGWAINLPLFAIAIGLLFQLLVRHTHRNLAALMTVLFALSPFTLFNAASFYSHLFVAVLVLVTYLAHDRDIANPRSLWALAVGAALGAIGLTRTASFLAAAMPIGIDALCRKDHRISRLCLIAGGGAPFLAGLLWYQWQLTGSPFTLPYYLGGRTVDHLYFNPASVILGLYLDLNRLRELTLWVSPLIVPIWFCALTVKAMQRKLLTPDFVFPAGMLLYAFYPLAGGNRYGPRYYFDFWPMMLFTIATAYDLFGTASRKIIDSALMLSPVYGMVTTVFLARDYHQVVVQRNDIYARSQQDIAGRAVVCFADTTGPLLPFEPADVARNGIDADARILYINCAAKGAIDKIRAIYPDRQVLFYRWDAALRHGVVTPTPD